MMKKTLKELELNIPTIDLLDSRKIIGGYQIDAVDIFGTPQPDPEYDPGYDPQENNPQEPEEPDMYQGEDGRDNETGTGEQDNNDDKNEPTVQVRDGLCILGSIAATIQVATGCSAADAIKAANQAFNQCGLNPNPNPEEPGIKTPTNSKFAALLTAAGFEVTFGIGDDTKTPQSISNHFDTGGAGLGYISREGVGHVVYLEDYHLETNVYDYYDPVLGSKNSINGNNDRNFIV